MKKLITLWMLLLCVVAGVKAETVTIASWNKGTVDGGTWTAIGKASLNYSSKYNSNSTSVTCMTFPNSIGTNEHAVKLTGNFKAGDVITIQPFTQMSTSDFTGGSKYATILLYDSSAKQIADLTGSKAGALTVTDGHEEAGDPKEFTYTLENDYTELYFGRGGGTRINAIKIVVTREISDASEPISTTVSPTSLTLPVGQKTTLNGEFSGGSFTGEWVSDNEAVATVSQAGVVTGVSEGTAHITYQWVEDQSKDAYKATATVTVVEAFDPSSLSAVKTYDFANWGSTTLTIESTSAGKIYNAANNVNNDVFRCTNEGLTSIAIQAVLKDSKGWTINNNGLYEGGNAGRCAAICDVKAGQVIEFSHNSGTSFYTKNNGGDAGVQKIPLVEENGHHVYKALEDGMVGFELVKGHYVTKVVIYEKDTRIKTSLSFSEASANAILGETFTAPTLTKTPVDLEGVVYTSSNTAVATVNASTGEVAILAGGVTTITATFEETEEYTGSTASYELTVTDPSAIVYENEGVTITWPFDTGKVGQTADIDYNSAEEELFKNNNVSIGANLEYNGTQALNGDNDGLTSTKIKQNNAGSATEQKNAIKFTIMPKAGMTFTPTKVSFLATRCGTDGGKMEMAWIDSENATVALGSAAASKTSDDPARDNNDTNNATKYSYNLTEKGAKATTGECGLQIITYSANGKSYAFGQIVIEGTLSGQVSAVKTYTITAQVGTDGAGSVTPTEVIVDEGEGTTIEATANTGYVFQSWTRESDSETLTENPLIISNVTADETYTANFKKLYAITYDLSAEGVKKGTVENILQKEYASATDKFTAPQNKYLTKDGFTFVKWTDGTGDFVPGTEYTLTSDITLQPVFVENTQSLAQSLASTEVTWNFRASAVSLNVEGKTCYYVQQVQVNGESLDIALAIDATNGKLNNVGRTDAFAQANDGTVLTIPAISGMQVEIANVSTAFKTEGKTATTIAGSEDYTLSSDNKTATYTYTGSDATIDIAIGGDIRYISTISVTYPQTHTYVDVTSAGYRTFASSKALDFTGGVEGLTAYKATATTKKVSFDPIDGAVPAGEGMLLKANEGRYYIPIAVGTPVAIENAFVGVLTETLVEDAGIFVLMKKNDVVGFYKTTTAFTVGAHTAYLPAGIATGRSFIGFDDETTGIKTIENGQLGMENSVYDLQGRKLNAQPDSQLRKGLYIINGKKVVMK